VYLESSCSRSGPLDWGAVPYHRLLGEGTYNNNNLFGIPEIHQITMGMV